MYRYSMTQWITGNEEIEQSFIRLKKYGYDGIEFAGEPYTQSTSFLNALMKKYNICCTSICGIFTAERDLSSPVESIRQNAVNYLKDCVKFAAELGAAYIIVVPSPVGVTVPPTGCSYETARNNAAKSIREAAKYAEMYSVQSGMSVSFVIEAINRYETYLINTLSLAKKFRDEIGQDNVGIMADLFHMSLEEADITKSLELVAPYLMHVHIADNTREAAGMGSTDFLTVLRTLKRLNYQGSLTMEFLPRISNPYEAANTTTRSNQMDTYAGQSIEFLKALEKKLSL